MQKQKRDRRKWVEVRSWWAGDGNSHHWCRHRRNPCRSAWPACWCANWPSCCCHRRRCRLDFACSRLSPGHTRASRLFVHRKREKSNETIGIITRQAANNAITCVLVNSHRLCETVYIIRQGDVRFLVSRSCAIRRHVIHQPRDFSFCEDNAINLRQK